MFFVIESQEDFIEEKNNFLPANRGSILGDSNSKIEYL